MRKRIVSMGLLMTALTVLVFLGYQAAAEPDANAGATPGESAPSSDLRAKIAEARDAGLHGLLSEDEAEAWRSDDAIQRAKVAAGPNANAVLSLDIDASDNKMDDGNTSGTVAGSGTDVVVEVFISGLAGPIGGGVLSFDTDLLTVKSVALGAGFLLGTATTANISIGILPAANLTNGHLATVTFTTASDVTGMEFQVGASVSNLAAASGGTDMLTAAMPLTFNARTPTPTLDFDGDGTVGFSDFLAFSGQYGSSRGDGRYQVRYDLNSDGAIDFQDFLIFIDSFGGPGSPPGGGGGSSSRPDLIVESPSVSDNTLTTGQSFTLRATVRNSGTGSAAATTLRYYRSSNSTISTSDTEVGTDAVSGLSASNTSAESISLRAPSSAGTYYYGACVASVSEESNTDNNCSTGVRVTVSSGSGGGTPKMYWTDYGTEKIQRANLDGSNVEDLVTTGLTTPLGIALDVGRGKMYWADGGTSKIQRANLDGSNVEDLITTGLTTPLGIALDVGRGKMYWTDGGTSKIQRANLDGSNVEDLVTTGLRHPFGIALDVGRGKMYWPDNGTAKIQRANLDGSNVEDLITTGLDRPVGIALDVGRGKMYWTDSGTDKIQRANLDGSNVEDLITTGLSVPVGIALDIARGKMYWMDQDTDKIQRANLNGSNVEDLVTTGLDRPYSIALDTSGSISSGGGGGSRRPDLIVQSPSVDNTTPTTGQSLTLSATVRNQGTATAAATTLRYYRSSDATISKDDTAVGTDDAISGLAASGTSAQSSSVTAPSSAGTYYYGACVDAVINESDANNNCSAGVRVTVSSGGVGGICGRTTQVRDAILEQIAGVTNCAQVTKTHLTGLRDTLNIRRKELTALQTADFNDLSNLRVLRLGSNRLTALPDDIFLGLSNLQDLQLGGNLLNSLNADVFSNLSNLRKLDLGGNRLNRLPNGVFSNLSNLQVCFLHLNQLRSLPDSVFSGLSRLERLNLENNPGAPFPLTLSLERTDNANLLAPSPATVQLKVDKGAPFAMSISLSVTGGSLSQSTGTIAAGSTESRGITVRQSGGNSVRVGVRSVSEVPEDYKGLQISQPNRIVSLSLFATSSDLVVESPSVSDSTLTPGQSFTLRATVRNSGNSGTGSVAATTLRYYISSDATISTSDTEVGTDAVSGLSASGTSAESISFTAPLIAGTYYYGACVESVSGESNTDNNCSDGVRFTVSSGGDDHSNTRSGATSLSLGGSRSGQIETGDDVDYFRVQVSTSGTLTVYTTGNIDTYGTLQNSSGSTLENNDDDGDGTNFSIARAVSAGTYYVEVKGLHSGVTGSYTLHARFVSGGGGGGSRSPDLIVESPSVSDNTLTTGQSFTLRATVRNQGTATAAATTLRYYISSDATISTSDTEVGTDAVSGLSASGTSAESISLTAPSSSGTYYYGACVESVSGESNTDNNCSDGVRVTVSGGGGGGSRSPDLIVQSPSVDNTTPTTGQSLTLSATVRNQGTATATATTLRYYRSSDATISKDDTEVGTDDVGGLSASGTSAESVSLTAPSSSGTYYYGACVESVSGESNTDNNCSDGVRVTVSGGGGGGSRSPDLIVEWPSVDNTTPTKGQSLTLSAMVRNQGTAAATATTLRYYISSDATISTGDTAVGTDDVGGLSASGTSVESVSLTAPSSAGTYYYGACVESVSGESNSDNNCSDGVRFTVLSGNRDGTPMIYWTDSDYWTDLDYSPAVGPSKIQRSFWHGSSAEDLITTGLTDPRDIALDVGRGKMYWTDWAADKIQCANLDGSNVEDLIRVRDPIGIALDVGRGKMYWTEGDLEKIKRANLDGSNIEDLITWRAGLSVPYGIALDVGRGKMYWTEWGRKIRRANLDGSNVEDLITTGLRNPNGIALDVGRGKMYWTDVGTSKIQRANLDGSNVEDLITTGLSRPYGIALDVGRERMYWTDVGTSKIQRANLDGSNVIDLITTGLTSPRGIALNTLKYIGGSSRPYLIVESPSVSDNSLTTGQSFTLRVTVRNSGTGRSAATTLRYYRSEDSSISTFDTQVGTDSVSGLSASGTSAESISLTAPRRGTYYYGACVARGNFKDNCSTGVRVRVSGRTPPPPPPPPPPTGSLGACSVGMVVRPNQSCRISGGVFRNIGSGCFVYTPFGSGTFCTGSFNLNGFRGTRVGNNYRINAVP